MDGSDPPEIPKGGRSGADDVQSNSVEEVAPYPQYYTRVLPVPLSRRDNVLVLCKKLSKFYEPPLKSFENFHQVYINLPLSGKVNKRKYRKPSKTVK